MECCLLKLFCVTMLNELKTKTTCVCINDVQKKSSGATKHHTLVGLSGLTGRMPGELIQSCIWLKLEQSYIGFDENAEQMLILQDFQEPVNKSMV